MGKKEERGKLETALARNVEKKGGRSELEKGEVRSIHIKLSKKRGKKMSEENSMKKEIGEKTEELEVV